jgi:signal transduction histidine kinase
VSNEIDSENRSLREELRKLRAVCIFTGGAAHDYNNALTAVMGNISLAKLEVEGNQELMDLLKDAEKAAGRIKSMTEKVALFARGVKINRKAGSAGDVVRIAVSSAANDYPGTLKLDVTEGLPEVELDPDLIKEALVCIIENAREAAPAADGVIEVTVSREDVRNSSKIYGSGVADGDYIRISVKDNGKGFNPDDSAVLFDPFFSTKTGREGIGLALAYSTLKRHRGFITAALPQGGGSLFSVFIPLF